MRRAIVPLLAVGMAAGAAGYAGGQVKAPTVPADQSPTLARKAAKLHRLYHREAREARRLRHVLAHTPSVAEALTLASVAYGVPRRQLAAVAWCESTHRPHARNGSGASGLFQFMPGTWAGNRFGAAGLGVQAMSEGGVMDEYPDKGWVVRIALLADHYIFDEDEAKARRVYGLAMELGRELGGPPIAWIGYVELDEAGVPAQELPDESEWIE